jgi:hypothetical protein
MTTTVPTENPHPNIPFPPGAVKVDDWCDSTDTASRYFEGRNREVQWPSKSRCCPNKAIEVFVSGIQHADGRIDPEIVVHQLHSDYPIRDAGAARQLARAIMATADDFDRLGVEAQLSLAELRNELRALTEMVPLPAGADHAYPWEYVGTPNESRYFVGTRRTIGRVEILIDGTRYASGREERSLTVHGVDNDRNVPTDTARKIAASLIAAADEIDGLT